MRHYTSPWERGMAVSNSPGQYRALLPQYQAEFWLDNSNSMLCEVVVWHYIMCIGQDFVNKFDRMHIYFREIY